jgi:hypothetical protein
VAIRYQTYDDEDDEAVADALDGGAGTWTRLQLIEMDLGLLRCNAPGSPRA